MDISRFLSRTRHALDAKGEPRDDSQIESLKIFLEIEYGGWRAVVDELRKREHAYHFGDALERAAGYRREAQAFSRIAARRKRGEGSDDIDGSYEHNALRAKIFEFYAHLLEKGHERRAASGKG